MSMYVDFKEESATPSGLGNGLLWMLSGVMMGLLVGLAMYYFANRGIPSVEEANASQTKETSTTNAVTKKSGFAKDREVVSPFGASKNSDDPEELMVASLIDKNQKDEVKERPSFSYYAVLPDLNVPIQTIRNPSEKEIREQKEKKERERQAQLAAENEEKEGVKPKEATVEKSNVVAGQPAYLLQVASYKKRYQADRTRGRLKRKGMTAYVEKRHVKGRTWYRVMVGPVGATKLENWKANVTSLGHKPLIYPVK